MQSVREVDVLTTEDRADVNQFIEFIMPISEVRVYKYRAYLRNLRAWWLHKPFRGAMRSDLIAVWKGIDELKFKKGPAEPWTKRDYKLIIKRFFRWLRDEQFVRGLKVPSPDETVGPDDILTDEELFRVYGICNSLRDKAMSSLAYEAALRPHELLRLNKNDIMFDEYGAVVYVRPLTIESSAKTGARRVRVINAAPLLSNLIENHPLRGRDAPLLVDMSSNTTFERLKWTGYSKILRRWKRDAKIEKNFTAYLFRHTRLTHLAKFMTEAQLCVFAGWKIGSKMPRMYIHLSGRDVDDSLLKVYGIKKGDVIEAKVPKKCVRCGTLSNFEAEICSKCGMALSLTAAMKKDEEMAEEKRKRVELEARLARLESAYFSRPGPK